MKYTLFCIFCFLLGTCTDKAEDKKKQALENIALSPIKTLDRISDSILIGQLSSITSQDDVIMLADGQNSRVLVTDENFKLQHILGKSRGTGPGEFNYSCNPIINGNKIYIYDQGNQRINIFNKNTGKFIKNIKLAERLLSVSYKYFLDDINNIYFATDPQTDGKMLLKLDSNGKVIKRFGGILIKSTNVQEQMNSNYREMAMAKNRIVSVAVSLGIVEIFDLEGNKINSFDISTIEPIKTTQKLVQEDIKKNPASITVMNQYCYVRGDKLYIGISDRSIENNTKTKDILVFNWSDKHCELIKTIKLQTNKTDNGVGYEPLYLTEDQKTIYAQGVMTKNLYIFNMP